MYVSPSLARTQIGMFARRQSSKVTLLRLKILLQLGVLGKVVPPTKPLV